MTNENVPWSKLLQTPMGEYVMDRMSNPSLTYHNCEHIKRIYNQANIWQLPYDIDLDAAVLFHDSVYDNQPSKEFRSAELVLETAKSMPEWFEGIDVDHVVDLIMTTEKHKCDEEINFLMIKLDLADLGDPVQCRINFWDILRESCNLYEITPYQAAQGTIDFMTGFAATIDDNLRIDYHSSDFIDDGAIYWKRVREGVQDTLNMAYTVLEFQENGFDKI